MTVTDKHPTRVGQRVQESYGDTRGWVTGFEGNEVLVNWDEKYPVDHEVGNFLSDELRVVEVIRLDADHFTDPGLSPLTQQVTTGTEHVRYTFRDGHTARGLENARAHLLALSTSDGE